MDEYQQLVNELFAVLTDKGTVDLRLLKRIDAARGSRPRPFVDQVPGWRYIDGPSLPSDLEIERRRMVAAGLLPPTAEDTKRESDRAAAHQRHEKARLERVAAMDAANAAETRRPAILP